MILGFIGAGKMAGALAEGIARSGQHQFVVSSKSAASREALAAKVGGVTATNQEVAERSEVIFLCVKPGVVPEVLKEIAPYTPGKIVVSLAAGVLLKTMNDVLGSETLLLRAMPNTGALVGKSATALCSVASVPEETLALVESLFAQVGTVARTPESMIDAVIGVSGSGPAFVYTFFESLVDGGVLMGLPRPTAHALALQTLDGVVAMLRTTGMHPAQLRDMITSPGGTTIAGIEALEREGLRNSVLAAVRAAAEKSRSL